MEFLHTVVESIVTHHYRYGLHLFICLQNKRRNVFNCQQIFFHTKY